MTSFQRRRTGAADLGDMLPCCRLIAGAVVVYFVALATRLAVDGLHSGHDEASYWIGVPLACTLFAGAAFLLVRRMGVDLPSRDAWAAAAMVVGAVAATWTAAALDPHGALGDYNPLFSTATVAVVLLMVRGRLLLAWAVVVGNLLVGLVSGPLSSSDSWVNVVFPRASFTVFFVATCTALLLGPHITEMRGLAARRREDALGAESDLVDVADRDERIRRIDQRVRPLLEKVVAGEEITEDDVITARLKEARLRDGIRGRALDVTRVRTAVWAARRRGVLVTVLDDGGLTALDPTRAAAVVDTAARLLESELAALTCGDVVARIAPPGRDPIATITIVSGRQRRRVEITADCRVDRVQT